MARAQSCLNFGRRERRGLHPARRSRKALARGMRGLRPVTARRGAARLGRQLAGCTDLALRQPQRRLPSMTTVLMHLSCYWPGSNAYRCRVARREREGSIVPRLFGGYRYEYEYVDIKADDVDRLRDLVRRGDSLLDEGNSAKRGAWITEFLAFVQILDPLGEDYSGSVFSDARQARWHGGDSPKDDSAYGAVFGQHLGVARSLLQVGKVNRVRPCKIYSDTAARTSR